MRRGFTLIELMMASSLSVIVMGVILVIFTSVLRLAKDASDEMQATLHARALREKLYYNAKTEDGIAYGGLWMAREVKASKFGIAADLRFATAEGNPAWLPGQTFSDQFTFESASKIGANGAAVDAAHGLVYAYLTVEMGKKEKFKYKDRVVVPLTGVQQTAPSHPETCGALDENVTYYQY